MNFSSDADAILIYRPADDADDGQANAFAKKVVEDLRNILQGPTTLEPKIELDLDLRPEGKNGPLVRSYASCEEYYESWASTWERQALLRSPGVRRPATLNWRGLPVQHRRPAALPDHGTD